MRVEWVQAVLYQPPVVLGRQLLPLSAFHVLFLDSVDSPFVSGAECDLGDLLLAVHVCGLSWYERHRVFAELKDFRQWGKDQRKAKIDEAADTFLGYLAESWNIPEVWKTGEGQSAKANGAYHLAVFAMRHLGMSEAEAWDCPVSRVVCYREAYSEQETGKSDLVTEAEKAGMTTLRGENGG